MRTLYSHNTRRDAQNYAHLSSNHIYSKPLPLWAKIGIEKGPGDPQNVNFSILDFYFYNFLNLSKSAFVIMVSE